MRTIPLKPLLWLLLLLLSRAAAAAPRPAFLLLDPAALQAYKLAYQKGSPAESQQVKSLLAKADQALQRGPYSVTSKQKLPPSGDKHDFASQAPYFWPDPSKPDGKPYIQKDGLVNPESKTQQDDAILAGLCADVKTLALAYYFSGREPYATKAAAQLRTFFLDPATRMNPNLNFGQGIPGTTDGRSYGIIQTRHLVNVPEALALLSGSPSIDTALVGDLKSWFGQYTQWLTTSKLGLAEAATRNNHGTFYDLQVVDFALFTGNEALARRILDTQTLPRVATQFAPDGAQPLELDRTRPWNYVSMNLHGWVQLAVLARHLGLDLWQYQTPDGRGLRQAVAWFRPYLLGEKQMECADVMPSSNSTILALYHRAGPQYPELGAERVLAKHSAFVGTPWNI